MLHLLATSAARVRIAKGWLAVMVAATTALPAGTSLAQVSAASCGPVWGTRHWGPFDYRRTDAKGRALVENAHFTPGVETLMRGRTNAEPGPDLNYTLRAFPNHHRALVSATRLAVRERNDQPKGMEWPIECYYERALRFAPDDLIVRGLYAQWLGQRQRMKEAEYQLSEALELAKDDPLSHRNIGLIYLELGQAEAARRQAIRARELGWPGTDLIDKLRAGGHWREPVEATTPGVPATTAPVDAAASAAGAG